MFVDNSTVTDWEEADRKMLSFFRTITNLPNLEKQWIEKPWEEGGLGTLFPTTQKKAVELWKSANLVMEGDRIVRIQSNERTLFARAQEAIVQSGSAVDNSASQQTDHARGPHRKMNYSHLYFLNQYVEVPDKIFDFAVDNWYENWTGEHLRDRRKPTTHCGCSRAERAQEEQEGKTLICNHCNARQIQWRHRQILNFVKSKATKGGYKEWMTFTEAPIGKAKPDLIANQKGVLKVIDVVVCGENYLDNSYNLKIRKYGREVSQREEEANAEVQGRQSTRLSAEVFPVTISERGTFHHGTAEWMKNCRKVIAEEVENIFTLHMIRGMITAIYMTYEYANRVRPVHVEIEQFEENC